MTSVEAVLASFRINGVRVTSSRRLLPEVLFGTTRHLTAEELATSVQAIAPDVHISTIYRNLEELERLGVIAHAHLGYGPVTYQLMALSHAHLWVPKTPSAQLRRPDQPSGTRG